MKTKKHYSIIFFFCLLMLSATAFAQPTKMDSLHYSYAQLTAGNSTNLFVRDSIPLAGNCGYEIKKATINAYLFLGKTYKYGSSTFTGTVDVTIKGYSTFIGSGGLVKTYTTTLNIDNGTPEKLYMQDFTVNHAQINRFVFSLSNYSSSALIHNDSIQLAFYYTEEFAVDVKNVLLTNSVVTPANPTIFKWSRNCKNIPDYEFQLLRLFNRDPAKKTETDITETVDWDKALRIETLSGDTSLKLTLAEGQGYYIWRVRPIGTKYSGGIADSRNWGKWSNGSIAQDAIVNGASGTNGFFYTQFDNDLNWTYSRSFSEGDPSASKVRVNEKMTYANGLQQVKQNQAHLQTEDQILINQTVYDYSGRPALTTMSAPVDTSRLGYRKGFIKYGSAIYTAANFDENNKFSNPDPINMGPLATYYSDLNPDVTVPNAENYPFSRALYERDGTGRAREQGGPGETHRIKPLNDHTTKTFYAGVSDAELIKMFGDEAPAATSVHKMLAIDANKTASVSYMNKEGQTIATCLSVGTDNNILDTLSSQTTFMVTDTLRGNAPYGIYGISTRKPIAFAKPTTVTFNYSITAKEIKHLCTSYCKTCDYTVELLVRGDSSTQIVNKHLVSAASCGTASSYTFTAPVTLNAGSYIVEKRVYANNEDPASGSSTNNKATFLEEHLNSLKTSLQAGADNSDSLQTVYNYLSHSNMDGLYAYLVPGIDLSKPDSVFADSVIHLNAGCERIAIPVVTCMKYDCSDSFPDFEGYFNARWAGTPAYLGSTTDGYLKYFNYGVNRFAKDQFNSLVANMIADEYSCGKLWECWERLTQNYGSLKAMADTMPNYHFDLLREFLNATGRKYKNYSTDPAKYKEQAYQYFYYTGSGSNCDQLNPPWPQDSLYGLLQNKKWEQYYSCIINVDNSSTASVDPLAATAKAESECLSTCELRKDGFVESLKKMYHNNNVYVEGDKYYLAAASDTLLGQAWGFTNTPLPVNFSDYKPLSQLQCTATNLVEHCQQSCKLTVFYNNINTTQIDSIGSQAQIQAMGKAMTWNYDLQHTADGQSCGPGYVKLGGNTNLIKIWDKSYGGSGTDVLYGITELKNGSGGYLLVGRTFNSIGDESWWIQKVDYNGIQVWDTLITGLNYLSAAQETSDGGVIILGSGRSYYYVIKLSPNGIMQWRKTYSGLNSTLVYGLTIWETSDGHFLLGGSSDAYAGGDKSQNSYPMPDQSPSIDYWMLKIDANGNKIWDKTFGTNGDDYLWSIRETKEGTYILGGSAEGGGYDMTETPRGGFDYWIIEIDTAGTKIVDRRFGGSWHDDLYALEVANDGSFILSGGSNSDNNGDRTTPSYGYYDYWVIKVDNDGNGTKLWDSAYGGYEYDVGVQQMAILNQPNNGNYLIGGDSRSGISGSKSEATFGVCDYWIVCIDSVGNKKWDKTFGGTDYDYLRAVDQDKNGDYWFAGYSYSGISGNKTTENFDPTHSTSDFWVIKAREACSSDSICFKWINNTIVHPDTNTVVYKPISCDSLSAQIVYNSIQAQTGNFIQKQLDDFKKKYTSTCASPDSIKDNLVMSYPLGYHHYTLYYYDRAGNLVRTVPPKGVDLSKTTRMQHPAHSYVTEYRRNSIKQLISQTTPDGGTTDFWYDSKGQLRFTRNARQKLKNVYSYTKYDKLGNTIEVGESGLSGSGTFYTNADNITYPASNNTERTYTVYNTSLTIPLTYQGNKTQRYTQNRLSYTYNDDSVFTYFSYDPHGNVEWLIQDLPNLGKKFIRYEYDLISNKVLAVHYNEGTVDEYHHRYSYDADQRILSTETAWGPGAVVSSPFGGVRGGVVGWDRDAHYTYYKHGPLKRMELGEDNIQGVDYVYTLQGWLKGVNNVTSVTIDDPGQDNNNVFSKDVFGMVLGYHDDDFNRTGSKYNPATTSLISSQTGGLTNLYNGNISSWTLKKDSVNGSIFNDRKGFKYRYDQLNRLKTEDYSYNSGSTWQASATMDSRFTYDANGNIDSLKRWGYNGTNQQMDNMKFNYYPGTNRLKYVADAVPDGTFTIDADGQSAYSSNGNYTYTATGERAKDIKNGIDAITWTVYGKVKSIKQTDGDSLAFRYDAAGNRVMKYWKKAGLSPVISYYVKDASGNDMSIYESANSGHNYIYTLKENPIFGSEMLGVYKPNKLIKTDNNFCFTGAIYYSTMDMGHANGLYGRSLGKKEYFMKDHLDNIRTVFTDRKKSDGYADVKSYNNYYAYGMLGTGTNMNYSPNEVRFGMTGKEKDDEVFDITGASVDFGARMLDTRIPVWNTRDKLENLYPGVSPYSFALNTPIQAKDPDGNVVIFINGQHSGEGGRSEYWNGFDKKAQKAIGDYSARYYDGASGGWANTTSNFAAGGLIRVFSKSNVNMKQRIAAGYAMGQAQAADIINGLEKGESIKIVTHSMGTAYSRGFVNALNDYAAANKKTINIEYQVDIAAFDGEDLKANKSIKRSEFMSGDADFIANPAKAIGIGGSSDIPGAKRIPTEEGTGHGIGNYKPGLLPYIGNGGKGTEVEPVIFSEEKPKENSVNLFLLLSMVSTLLFGGCKGSKQGNGNKTILSVSPEEYKRDSLYLDYTVWYYIHNRINPYAGYKTFNTDLNKVKISIDSIFYSPDKLKIFAFVIQRNPNDEGYVHQSADHSFDGTCLIGFRDSINQLWKIYSFDQLRPSAWSTYDQVYRLFRKHFFNRFKTDTENILNYDPNYGGGINKKMIAQEKEDEEFYKSLNPKHESVPSKWTPVFYGYNLDEEEFWTKSLVWQKGASIPGYYNFQLKYQNCEPGDEKRCVLPYLEIDYPQELLEQFKNDTTGK